MSFYFPVVLTSTILTSLAETTLNVGMAGEAIMDNKELMESMVNTIRTTVAGKGPSHRQALIVFYYK